LRSHLQPIAISNVVDDVIDRALVESAPAQRVRSRRAVLLTRAEQEGPDALTTEELVALVAAMRAGEVEPETDVAARSRMTPSQLRRDFGLSRAGAVRLAAAFALGRRVERAVRDPRVSLRSPALVHELMAPEVRGLCRETFHALLLDGKHRLQRRHRVSEGTLTSSLVHPREVFGPALREGAAALIVVHNHPSGDPEPSAEDVAVTRRLIEAGQIVGIPLLDHVVVGAEGYVSIRERIRFEAPG
jgi:DNA repair protein RadC